METARCREGTLGGACRHTAVERTWHICDSQGQILVLVLKEKSLTYLQLLPLRWEAGMLIPGRMMESSVPPSVAAGANPVTCCWCLAMLRNVSFDRVCGLRLPWGQVQTLCRCRVCA